MKVHALGDTAPTRTYYEVLEFNF